MKFDYTNIARSFALRNPRLNYILIQINFWVMAFLLLSAIMQFNTQSIAKSFDVDFPDSYIPALVTSIIAGVIFGIIFGLIDLKIEQILGRIQPVGAIILIKAVIYLITVVGMMAFLRYILWEPLIIPLFFEKSDFLFTDLTWKYNFLIQLVYTFAMSVVISFINLMNKKFGPGVLVPMLFGKYKNPIEEERVFLFMDMKSSTSHAEKLGHIRYSEFIRDCFLDINKVLTKFHAEIYQYVGDEIVLTWQTRKAFEPLTCIEFYFATDAYLRSRETYYDNKFGILPKFNAGAHFGMITGVEIGDIKREVAFHGDTINVAARIQKKCDEYQSDMLISEDLEKIISWDGNYRRDSVGSVLLKGRTDPVKIFKISSTLQG